MELAEELWNDLDPDQKVKWSHIESMTGSPGWKLFQQDLEDAINAARSQMDNASNWEEYLTGREAWRIYNMIYHYSDMVAQRLQVEVANAST